MNLTFFIFYSIIMLFLKRLELRGAIERTKLQTMVEIYNKTGSKNGLDDLKEKYIFFYKDDWFNPENISKDIEGYLRSDKAIFDSLSLAEILKTEKDISVYNLFGEPVRDDFFIKDN